MILPAFLGGVYDNWWFYDTFLLKQRDGVNWLKHDTIK